MEKDHGLIFDAAEIREKGGLTASRTLAAEIFAGLLETPAAVDKAAAELTFSVGGDALLLEASVKAVLHLECARCGRPFTADFSETFDEVYEDAVESIDVRGPLMEAVALMPPLKPLCAEGCRGLCQVCGGDLNLKDCGCADPAAAAGDDGKENPFSGLKGLSLGKNPADKKEKKRRE